MANGERLTLPVQTSAQRRLVALARKVKAARETKRIADWQMATLAAVSQQPKPIVAVPRPAAVVPQRPTSFWERAGQAALAAPITTMREGPTVREALGVGAGIAGQAAAKWRASAHVGARPAWETPPTYEPTTGAQAIGKSFAEMVGLGTEPLDPFTAAAIAATGGAAGIGLGMKTTAAQLQLAKAAAAKVAPEAGRAVMRGVKMPAMITQAALPRGLNKVEIVNLAYLRKRLSLPGGLNDRDYALLQRLEAKQSAYVTARQARAGEVPPREAAMARPPAAPSPAVKQPWQMTKVEFETQAARLSARYNEILDSLLKKRISGEVDFNSPVYRNTTQDALRLLKKELNRPDLDFGIVEGAGHQASVRFALQQGKSVAPKVLADYPDLAAKAPVAAAPVTKPAPLAGARGAGAPEVAPVRPAGVVEAPPALTEAAAVTTARPQIVAGGEKPVIPLIEGVPSQPPPAPPAALGPEQLPTGELGKSLNDASEAITRFGRWLASPESQNAWDLTVQLRKETLAKRVARLQVRAQELLVEGKSAEEAMQQAIQETMSGRLPTLTSDLTTEFRDALFAKVYQVLADEPFEMMSTAEALRHALAGKPVPRVPGMAGGSAYSRLLRVFGDNPEIMEQLAKGQKIEDAIEQGVLASAKKPVGVDQELFDYLSNLPTIPHGQPRLGEKPFVFGQVGLPPARTPLARAEALIETVKGSYPDIRNLPVAQRQALLQELRSTGISDAELGRLQMELWPDVPPKPVRAYEAPVERAVKQPHLMPLQTQHRIIRSLKEAGWTAADIGNFLRANKASFDFSFWRQQAPLILGHKRDFAAANVEAWRALWSEEAAKRSWKGILDDPLYTLYDELNLDFLRPYEMRPGMARGRGVEEFGYLQADRPIPKFTGKLPWVKVSQRSFVTGTNEHNWRIFKRFYQDMLRVNERYASGAVKLKEGEAFSIRENMRQFGTMLEDFSGRAQLGKAREIGPALSGLIFAPRYALGRLISPRHLFSSSKYVRAQAWKDAATFVGGFGSILVLGQELGLWHVEVDPRSSDFAKLRVGNVRIDPWGGYQPFVRYFAQVITNSGIENDTGQPYKLDPLAATTRFLRGKASPLASMVADFKTGKTYVGDKVNLLDPMQWVDRVAPLLPMDIYDAVKYEGPLMGIAVTLPGAVGAGVATYESIPLAWRKDMNPYFALPTGTRRTNYRETHPDVDAKLFITGAVGSLQGPAGVFAAVDLIQKNNVKWQNISGIKSRQDALAAAKKEGVSLQLGFVDNVIARLTVAAPTKPAIPSKANRGLEALRKYKRPAGAPP